MSDKVQIDYTITGSGKIIANVGCTAYHIDKSHPGYNKCIEAIKKGNIALFVNSASIPQYLNTISQGKVIVKDDKVYYNNEEIHNSICSRIIEQIRQGFKVDNLIAFLENLMDNPSRNSVEQLYGFLERKNMPITADGCFKAYKSVKRAENGDIYDWHTGTVLNNAGCKPKMTRNKVDDDKLKDCSYGYHVGSLEYALNFNSGSNRVMLIVKVNPKDVVSVPEYNTNKCRVCEYEVIGEYQGPLPDLTEEQKETKNHSDFDDYDFDDYYNFEDDDDLE